MPTDTIEQYIAKAASNPIIAQAIEKAQENDTKVSQIYDRLITPQIKEVQERNYTSKIIDDIKEDLSVALEKIGPEARNKLITYFAGGDLYKNIVSAIENGQSREALRQRYNDESWTNAVRKIDYSTAEEKTREYAAEVKAEEISRISKQEDKEKIKYLLSEIQDSSEKNEIYEQIATILKGLGYKPKSLEDIASQNNNKSQHQQKNPQDSRNEQGNLEKSAEHNQQGGNNQSGSRKESSLKKFGKIENANDYFRYITGLNKEKINEDQSDYNTQFKELKNAYLESFKLKENEEKSEKESTIKNKIEAKQEEPKNNESQQPDFISGLNQAAQNIKDAFEQGANNINEQYQQTTQRQREETRRENTEFAQNFTNGMKDSFEIIFKNLNQFYRNTNEQEKSESQNNQESPNKHHEDFVDAEFEIVEENQSTQEPRETLQDAIIDIFSEYKPHQSNNSNAGLILTRENFDNFKSENKNYKTPSKPSNPGKIIGSEINPPRKTRYFLKHPTE